MLCVKWYSDWRDYKILPYGGNRLDEQPAFVYDAIDLAAQTIKAIEVENAKKQKSEIERKAKKGRRHGRS
jgi:hypothetical protein